MGVRLLTWFAIAGGPAAWAVHLLTAWSVNELSCLAPGSGAVLLHGGSLGTRAHLAVWAGTVVPLLVALAAVVACGVLTRGYRAERAEDGAQTAILERTNLLLVLGWFLSLMSVAAITGGGIALLVLEPCA